MIAILIAVILLAAPGAAQAQSPQQLFESGRYQDVVDQIGARPNASPDDLLLLARANLKLGRTEAARTAYTRLQTGDASNVWRLVGNSGVAETSGDTAAAVDNARKAVAVSPQNFGAQYQLGLALAAAKDFPGSAAAFEQAAKINPSFAYAHYYAGMARYSARQVDRMAAHFKTFAKLAPMAPERPAVENIMRTLGGR
jgi:tetratricopeptide (TPR) repeat protein